MIQNFLKTQITVYDGNSVNDCGDVFYDAGVSMMAKIEVHPVVLGGMEGLIPSSTMTVYIEHECPPNVLIEYSGNKHSSTSVTNYYKFGVYQYTKVELA